MKKTITTLLGASFASLLLVACGVGGGGAAAPVDDTPEGAAINYRQSNMKSIAYKVGQLRGWSRAKSRSTKLPSPSTRATSPRWPA